MYFFETGRESPPAGEENKEPMDGSISSFLSDAVALAAGQSSPRIYVVNPIGIRDGDGDK